MQLIRTPALPTEGGEAPASCMALEQDWEGLGQATGQPRKKRNVLGLCVFDLSI